MACISSSIALGLILAVLGIGNAVPATAQAHEDDYHNATTRPVIAVAPATRTPRVDASPDDPAWRSASMIDGLSLAIGPAAEGLRPLPTQVLVQWQKDYLYVRFVCMGGDLYVPDGALVHDAPLHGGEVVEVFLDPAGDGRQFLELQVNPRNTVLDMVHLCTGEAKSGPDLVLSDDVLKHDMWAFTQWDLTGLRTATRPIVQDGQTAGWVADLALPAPGVLRRLGISTYRPMTLRANFLRYNWLRSDKVDAPRRLVAMNWAPVMWGRPHRSPAAMGYLKLVPGP